MSFQNLARLSHRKGRDSIVDPAEKPELTAQEFLLHKAVRSAITTANIYGVSKAKIAAVVERTLRDHAFQARVLP